MSGDPRKSISSMSKTTVPVGRPARPLYASACGTQQRRVSPIVMRITHSRQPAITRSSGNVDVTPRATVLSNIIPSLRQPV
jgi:hypothetical protein